MQKTKILAFVTLILFFIASNSGLAFAIEEDHLGEEADLSEKATFEAETKVVKVKTSEVIELKESFELLRAELSEMKSGIKQIQTKMMEAEMEELRRRLESLQQEITTGEKEHFVTETPLGFDFDFDSTSVPVVETLQETGR